MNLFVKSFLLNFVGFAPVYLLSYFLLSSYTSLDGLVLPVVSAIIAFLLAPRFQVVNTQEGKKLYMRWLLLKGVREVK